MSTTGRSFAAWAAGGYAAVPVPRLADPGSLQTMSGRTMGTTWSLRLDNRAMLPTDLLRAAVQGALDRVVQQMSTWEPASDISRFNRAPAGTKHVVPAEMAQVLACALRWAAASGGAVDPTIGALVGLWGFGAHAQAVSAWPEAAALEMARAHSGWQRLAFDPSARTMTQPGGLCLDLSGIAKGFAVDLAAEALQALGVADFLIEVGGELRGCGRRPGNVPWQVEVDTGSGQALRCVLADRAIATSGDRWHARDIAGRRRAHTIDPRTGEPVAHALASVSVLHASCMEADALATALTVLGPDEGLALAQSHDIAAVFACRDAGGIRLVRSSAWPAPGP